MSVPIELVIEKIKKQKDYIDYTYLGIKLQEKLASGYGKCIIKTTSHRNNKRMKSLGIGIESAYGSFYRVDNTEDVIKKIRSIGCTVSREKYHKPYLMLKNTDYTNNEWGTIMQTVLEQNLKYIFTQDNIANFLHQVGLEFAMYDDNFAQVKHLQQIIIIGDYHIHLSENECAKVININDASYQESLMTFSAIRKSIDILLKTF